MASSSGKGKRKENPCHNNECYVNNNGSSNTTTLGPFPPGFKFDPTDEQLIECYLRVKVDNKEKLPPNLMHDIDLYQPDESLDPDQLSARYEPQGEGEWYFFTPRDKKYPNGDRPNRASGGGFWKATSKDAPIKSNGKLIGFRKSLVFNKGKPPSGIKTNWIMHEFRLENHVTSSPRPLDQGKNDHADSPHQLEQDGNSSKRNKLNDWVLFRIHYNTRGAKRRAIPVANIVKPVANYMNYPYHDPHQNGQSSAYSTPEDVKVTYDNTVTIPNQLAGYHPTYHPYQSEILASEASNANSKPEDVHITNNNTVTIPTQFANNPTQYSNQPVLENTSGNIWPTTLNNVYNQTNDFEICNTSSANPFTMSLSEFGVGDDFNSIMDFFLGDDQLQAKTGELDISDMLDMNFDDISLTNVLNFEG